MGHGVGIFDNDRACTGGRVLADTALFAVEAGFCGVSAPQDLALSFFRLLPLLLYISQARRLPLDEAATHEYLLA